MQPERINPEFVGIGYDIRSDVWSLGISMVSNDAWTWAWTYFPTNFFKFSIEINSRMRVVLTLVSIFLQTFPRDWPFVRGIHRSPVDSTHKGQWRGALILYPLLNKRLSKQWRRWWLETPSRSLWRLCIVLVMSQCWLKTKAEQV